METTQKIIHAYKQAPWRIQLRGVAWVLLVLVIFVIIAIANLNISAKTYASGVEIQVLESEKDDITNHIADLKNQLGTVTSIEVMAQRTSEKGYMMVNNPDQVIYLSIPGYQKPFLNIDTFQTSDISSGSLLKPVYTQSLWDLLFNGGLKLSKYSQRFTR